MPPVRKRRAWGLCAPVRRPARRLCAVDSATAAWCSAGVSILLAMSGQFISLAPVPCSCSYRSPCSSCSLNCLFLTSCVRSRKHTGERPFACHCGKQFSRLDNLRQVSLALFSADSGLILCFPACANRALGQDRPQRADDARSDVAPHGACSLVAPQPTAPVPLAGRATGLAVAAVHPQ